MKLEHANLMSIESRMDEIKKAVQSNILTNYFKQPMTGNTILGTCTRRSILFLNDDTDFYRLYYYSSDQSDLAALLKDACSPGRIVIDYVTREPDEHLQQAFREAGFRDYAMFVRLANHHLKVYDQPRCLQYAEPGDLDGLWSRLMEFDKYVDHFPDKQTLLRLIEDRQALLNKVDGAIRGYIIFRVMGSKANFNYFYNKSDDPRDTLVLLRNFYGVLHERGIKSAIAWVNITNSRVLRLHAQFGWKEDGLKDFFYLK